MHVLAIGVNVSGVEVHIGVGLEELGGIVGEDVGVTAHFVDGPVAVALANVRLGLIPGVLVDQIIWWKT